MNRSLFILSIATLLPTLACAQETKLVNCRTLEQVGNFIGADEVLDKNNLVCQVVKVGTSAAEMKAQAMKPLPGAVISDNGTPSVAEVAKSIAKPTVKPQASSPLLMGPQKAPKPEFAGKPAPAPTLSEIPAPGPVTATRVSAAPAAAPAAAAPAASPRPAAAAPQVVVARPVGPKKAAITEVAAAPAPATNAPPSAPVTTAAALPPQYEPESERERVVRLGMFEKPREEAPISASLKSAPLTSEEDGFHEGQRPECTKNITLAGLKGEKLVLGTPEWAAKWIERNQKRMPQVCFSDTPMPGARNYLIVFYTTPAPSATALANTALDTPQGTPASGVGAFTTSYGSTWHYAYDRNVGLTVNSQDDADKPHSQLALVRYATAYTEEGVPVSESWPGTAKNQEKLNSKDPKKVRDARTAQETVSNKLLTEIVDDIAKL